MVVIYMVNKLLASLSNCLHIILVVSIALLCVRQCNQDLLVMITASFVTTEFKFICLCNWGCRDSHDI